MAMFLGSIKWKSLQICKTKSEFLFPSFVSNSTMHDFTEPLSVYLKAREKFLLNKTKNVCFDPVLLMAAVVTVNIPSQSCH